MKKKKFRKITETKEWTTGFQEKTVWIFLVNVAERHQQKTLGSQFGDMTKEPILFSVWSERSGDSSERSNINFFISEAKYDKTLLW